MAGAFSMTHTFAASAGGTICLVFNLLQSLEFFSQKFFNQALFRSVLCLLQHMLNSLDIRLCDKSFDPSQ